jgi:hypothetical protein
MGGSVNPGPRSGESRLHTAAVTLAEARGRSRPASRKRGVLIALGLSALVVTVGVLSYVVVAPTLYAVHGASKYPAPPVSWVTFRSAWAAVSGALSAFANGSWRVSFAEGVAADAPWSPPLDLLPYDNVSAWDSCEAELSGVSTLTYWNASIYPASTSADVFSSGAAPLWTFVVNGSDTSTYVASWFLGNVTVNAELDSGSSCLQFPIFNSTSQLVHPSQELDSSAIASEVSGLHQNWTQQPPPTTYAYTPMPSPPVPEVALYFPGLQSVSLSPGGPSNGDWTVDYQPCGLVGSYGLLAADNNYQLNSTVIPQNPLAEYSTTALSCYDSAYQVHFNQTSAELAPMNSGNYVEFTLNVTLLTSAVPARWNLSDLSTSLFVPEASVPGDSSNPLTYVTPELCGPGSTNLSSCPPPAQGWYAVLLGPTGNWMDSFPTTPYGGAWAAAGVGLQSGDRIALVQSNSTIGQIGFLGIASGAEPTVFGYVEF